MFVSTSYMERAVQFKTVLKRGFLIAHTRRKTLWERMFKRCITNP